MQRLIKFDLDSETKKGQKLLQDQCQFGTATVKYDCISCDYSNYNYLM